MQRDAFIFDEFAQMREVLQIYGTKILTKQQKRLMQKAGFSLKRTTKQKARALVKQKSGGYHRSIKKGKLYTKDDMLSIRVYSNEPHAHLIEEGHYQVVNPGKGKGNGRGVIPGKGIGERIGFVSGRWVFDKGLQAYIPKFEQETEDLVDEVIAGICK